MVRLLGVIVDSLRQMWHPAVVGLFDDFAAARPEDVTRRGGDTFIAFEVDPELINEAKRRGIKVLGLESFLVGSDAVYPALSRDASGRHMVIVALDE